MANCQNHMRGMYRSPQNACSAAPFAAAPRPQAPCPSAAHGNSAAHCSAGRTSAAGSAAVCRCRDTGCPDTADFFPKDMPPAMAYVPWQKWQDLYEPAKGLQHGTIFAELDKPFLWKGGRCR